MHHGRAFGRNLETAQEPALSIGDVIGEEGRHDPVSEEMQFTRQRTNLGVRRKRRFQSRAEIMEANRVKLACDFHGQRIFGKGKNAVGVHDDARVCDAAADIQRCLRRELLAVKTRRPDPPVAIPLGFAVPDRDAVNHAIAEKPMRGLALAWVGAIPGIQAAKFRRDAPFHGQIKRRRLFAHGRVIASHP